MLLNALTIDVEDYFQVSAFERSICRREWDRFDSRVEANTHAQLELLARNDTQATFYVLGWVAERFPQLVRTIQAAGHEIASHSHWHHLVYRQTASEFRDDVRRARDTLEAITSSPVRLYRAPSFSIVKRSLWALEVLVEEGFTCDSSIFPVYHDRYGIPGAKRDLHQLETPAGRIWEFPPSVSRIGRMNLPVSGGGYFRLYPFAWTRRCLKRINQGELRSFMFYLHPWEFDPAQPRLDCGSPLSRWRHYLNLASLPGKFERLLREFRFGRVCDVVARQGIDLYAPRLAAVADAVRQST